MIENVLSDIDINKELNDLLIYEKIINYKKENNIPLDSKEYFFDNYLLSPSFLLSMIKRRVKNDKKINRN